MFVGIKIGITLKSIFLLLFVLLSSFLFMGNGCAKRSYYQLIAYDTPTPLVYEIKRDTTSINSFAGIDYMQYDGYYENEKINVLRINYQSSKTKKFTVANFALQIFAGNYNVRGIDGMYTLDSIYDGNKLGFGGRLSLMGGINFNIQGFRIGIGAEPSLNLDLGEYSSFRIEAGKLGVINSNAGFVKFNMNIFPYISIPVKDGSLFNLQMNVGLPGFYSPILSFQIENHVFWMSYVKDRINIGLMLNYDQIKDKL